jgi:hypothetical protein
MPACTAQSIAIAISATMQMGIEPISAAAGGADQVQKRVAVPLQLMPRSKRERGSKKRKTRNLSRPATREMKTRNQFFFQSITWSGEKVVFPVGMQAVRFAPHIMRMREGHAGERRGAKS